MISIFRDDLFLQVPTTEISNQLTEVEMTTLQHQDATSARRASEIKVAWQKGSKSSGIAFQNPAFVPDDENPPFGTDDMVQPKQGAASQGRGSRPSSSLSTKQAGESRPASARCDNVASLPNAVPPSDNES
jgi:hypothetical protein